MKIREFIDEGRGEIEAIRGLDKDSGRSVRYMQFRDAVANCANINFKRGKITNKTFVFSYGGSDKNYAELDLMGGADNEVLVDNPSLVDDSLERMKELNLEKGRYTFDYGVSWDSQDFIRTTKFPGGLKGIVRILAHASTIDPSRKKGSQWASHKVNVKTEGRTLELEAEGDYRFHLKGVLERVHPQLATLHLSASAAEMIMKKRKNLKEEMERKGKDLTDVVLHTGGNISFKPHTNNEIEIRTKDWKYWEDLLGIPLINTYPKEYSQVTSFKKIYGPIALLKRDRLNDLRSIVGELGRVDLGIVNFESLITEERAKQILEDELDRHNKAVSHEWFSPSSYNCLRFIGLVAEYCGNEVSRGLDTFAKNDFEGTLAFLRRNGYQPRGDIEGNDWTAIVRHTFSFIQQCHERDPTLAISGVRRQYKNRNDGVRVFGEVTDIDASKLKDFIVPEGTRLDSIKLKQKGEGFNLYSNSLYVKRPSVWYDTQVEFRFHIDFDNPRFLPAQEYVLDRMGITFNSPGLI